jgi:hypothetical protein
MAEAGRKGLGDGVPFLFSFFFYSLNNLFPVVIGMLGYNSGPCAC